MKCAAILEKLMKGKHGPLFSSPVEWNAGYLPDYPQYVKCPMDLGLVHKNLTAGRYARLEDFANDVRLVWRNALLYNFPTSYGFFKDTREKAREFERELAVLEDEQEKAARARTPQLDSLARCALLLRDLRMNPYAEQLLEPVSGVPEYEAVVRSPMDLGTVGRKLECGAYLSADGFARDVGLVLQNAIVFNSWRYAAAQFWRNSAQFCAIRSRPIHHLYSTHIGEYAALIAHAFDRRMKLFRRPLHLHVTVQDKALPPSERRTLFEQLEALPLAELVSWVLGVKCQPWGTSAVTERGTTLEVNIDALGEEVRQYGSGGDGGRGDPTFSSGRAWCCAVARGAGKDLGGHREGQQAEAAESRRRTSPTPEEYGAAERQKPPPPALLPRRAEAPRGVRLLSHLQGGEGVPDLAKWATTMKLRPHEPNASYFVDPDGSVHGLPPASSPPMRRWRTRRSSLRSARPRPSPPKPPPASRRGPIRALSSAHTSSSRPTAAAAAAAAATASRS